jgi:hypothetical protein
MIHLWLLLLVAMLVAQCRSQFFLRNSTVEKLKDQYNTLQMVYSALSTGENDNRDGVLHLWL